MPTPARLHLRTSQDLVTPYAAIRAGFVQMAIEKNRKATPFVAQARSLKARATNARNPGELLTLKDIQPAMLAAAGLSDKAMTHLQDEDRRAAVLGLIENFLEPAGSNFVEVLVFRFLLTRGDTLGGSMRNIAGALAQRKLSRAIISSLRLARQPYHWLRKQTKSWALGPADDADIEIQLRGLAWRRNGSQRTLLYNVMLPLTRNNIDICLFDCSYESPSPEIIRSPQHYIALGELKGGIDPAGADEHWKTARSAIERIKRAFKKSQLNPKTFFVASAIEKSMANEIWNLLSDGDLDNAANLTDDQQLDSIARWICSL